MEARIARIARVARGIVTRAQLLELGVSDEEILHRAKIGYLIRLHRGVYRVGHSAPSYEADYFAAVKACGAGAVLCCRAAAYHQGLLPLTRNPPPPEVMCRTERRVAGVQTRRARSMHPLEIAEHRGIPITTVPRTLVDLAATASEGDLARAVHEAWVKHRTGPPHVQAVLERYPNANGAGALRRVLTGETPVLLSRLESAFHAALDEAGIERPPEVNRRAGSKSVDFRWPGRLVAELDSFAFHNTRHAWEQDRVREREARSRREAFRRYTWWDVHEGRAEMLAEVRRLLRG